ncbi:hypothetical protein R1sor_000715 [Riccia sorocarpa]|uniref:Uncharacterized protein n=1 Tax=Riccia sorocarpa TaxID=122646 RepID=A0ABD3GU70_9MARC
MRVLKEFIRQNAKMEGSIPEGYLVMEDMFYGSEFLSRLDPGAPLSSMADFENEKELGEVPYGASTREKLDKTMLHQTHIFVLHNAECMQSWLDRYSMDHPPNKRNRPTFLGYMGEMQKLSDQGDHQRSYIVPHISRCRQIVQDRYRINRHDAPIVDIIGDPTE